MRLFGHPVHLMLVHFPAALLPMEFVCYLVFLITGNETFGSAGWYAMAGGTGLGWIAAATGLLDLIRIPADQDREMKTALTHGGLQVLVLIVYTVLAFSIIKSLPVIPQASLPLLILKGILMGILLAGNYFGGNLILRYGIGTQNADRQI